MPNCDFYATPEDHAGLLAWLFAEGTCEVYELSSRLEQPLRRFASSDDVLALFEECYPDGGKVTSVHLQLYVLGAGPPFVPTRIALNAKYCDGATFRYDANGWGLVQLYLEAVGRGELRNSHTNHFSQKGARGWEPVVQDAGYAVDTWDFKRITAFSSRLNRQIRKQAVGKIGSRPVLPGAIRCWEAGVPLPYLAREMSLQDIRNSELL